MSVYMIFRLDVTDLAKLHAYGTAVQPLLRKHQAEVLVVDLDGKTLEGNGQTFSVVLKFRSNEHAMAFFDDPNYAPLKMLRSEATTNSSIILCKAFETAVVSQEPPDDTSSDNSWRRFQLVSPIR
jgi:uncharacterized protein (DUF1330 family)